jgi:hypothetical protein
VQQRDLDDLTQLLDLLLAAAKVRVRHVRLVLDLREPECVEREREGGRGRGEREDWDGEKREKAKAIQARVRMCMKQCPWAFLADHTEIYTGARAHRPASW